MILHPAARTEMFDAADFYENACPRLGHEFLAEVESAFGRIKSHPEMGKMLKMPYRRAMLHRFPFGVIYREHAQNVCVVALMHCKRKPGYWIDRIAD